MTSGNKPTPSIAAVRLLLADATSHGTTLAIRARNLGLNRSVHHP